MKNNALLKRLEVEGVSHAPVAPHLYERFRRLVDGSFAHLSDEDRHIETVVMCLTHPDSPHATKVQAQELPVTESLVPFPDNRIVKWLRIIAILLGILVALFCVDQARAAGGTSQIDVIKVTDGVTTLTAAAPFKISFSGCSVSGTGSAWAINCTGGAANPGGSAHQLQVNLSGTGFAGIANGTAGQVLCSNGTTLDPAMCDPVVSGPDAPGVAPTKPPVQVGLFDGTNVQRILGSAAGRLSVDVNSAPTTAVTGTFFQATQPVSVADGSQVTLGAKADAKSAATDSTAITLMQVLKEISAMEQAPASRAVTNAGTFATQSAQSGTWTVQPGNTANTTPWLFNLNDGTNSLTAAMSAYGTAPTGTKVLGVNAFVTNVNANGQATMANSAPVVIASDQSAVHTVCDSGCSSSAGFADNATFTTGTTAINPVGGLFDDTPPTAVATGKAAVARITNNRALHINLRNQAGTEIGTSTTPVQVSLANTAANATAVKVDGSAVTQPVSGTVTANAGTNLNTSLLALDTSVNGEIVAQASTTSGQKGHLIQGAVTTAAPTYTTAQTSPLSLTTAGALRVDGSGATQPVSGTVTTTPPSNASTNVAQVAGTTTDTNSGVKSAGTLRVVLATDQPALTNKLLVTPDSVALPANQSVNVSQVNGVTPLMGNGTTGTGSQRVTIASDNTAFSVNAAGTLTDNNAAPSTTNVGAMPCMARTDLRAGTAATAGRLIFPDCGTDGLVHVAALPDSSLKRFAASSKFAASSTTDNWRISGNASNTVILTDLSVTCTQTTAGMVSVVVRKESTAVSGGTAATVTNFPVDSNKAAASSVVQSFTGTGPTVGTLVGDLDDSQFGCMASGTATPNDIYIYPHAPGAPIAILRGTAEGVALNFGGALTGGNLTVKANWLEVTTITP